MRAVRLGGSLESTALGLGCAGLYRVPSGSTRRRLLETALDSGIRHFDTAPMYGLGRSEPELGRFIQERRAAVVVATKFGIMPTAAGRAAGRIQGPLRRVLAAAPGLQRRAQSSAAGPTSGTSGALLYDQVGYDAAAARRSLERSLRDLRADYVDLLLLHDPAPGSLRSDDVLAYLEDATRRGQILAWGVAGEPEPTDAVAAELTVSPPVMQVRDDLLEPPRPDARRDVIFGVLGRALMALRDHSDRERAAGRTSVSDQLVLAHGDAEAGAALLLAHALATHPSSTVLFTSTKIERVQAAAELAGSAMSPDDPRVAGLEALRDTLRASAAERPG